jgi:hypothetical protein
MHINEMIACDGTIGFKEYTVHGHYPLFYLWAVVQCLNGCGLLRAKNIVDWRKKQQPGMKRWSCGYSGGPIYVLI